ncbi:putative stromal membrane-associated protein [Erysiphe necator]|uniref:Putative stromal membrane-associated protein n=1 Tax=Uncinula necator TaxID=52586 RepID=A0A0B1P2K6_UNCNE|nr:putative stromal membrane-associated protein [Erysiphe necator]
MSRRTPNPAAERAARNAQTIKSLLKLEGNKTCADCKRNKHPRWASWNIGVFICIRCSGIHRGMGTHISRVKSVDLDAWTDEQLQSILKWGNLRANKYWEAKLATGHIPSESKMENFIRTKYESKRWVLEEDIPDPSTLGVDGDDDVPLSLVKQKQDIERLSSQRTSLNQSFALPQSKRAPQPDLLESNNSIASREGSANFLAYKLPSKSEAAPPKQTKPMDSLLGLDFFGTGTAPPARLTNSIPISGAQSRPDLKQSILSLYASTSRPQQQTVQSPQNIFGPMQSPLKSPADNASLGSLSDAFSSLKFPTQKSSSAIGTTQIQPESPASNKSSNALNTKTITSQTISEKASNDYSKQISETKNMQSPVQSSRGLSISNGIDTFNKAIGPLHNEATDSSSRFGDMFNFATPISTSQDMGPAPISSAISPASQKNSVFNLTTVNSPLSKSKISPVSNNLFSNSDAWGSNDAWASATDSSSKTKIPASPARFEEPRWGSSSGNMATNLGTNSFVGSEVNNKIYGSYNTPPVVSVDEEFGGWGSATTAPVTQPVATTVTTSVASHKPAAGFAGNDDLFSNVWG